MGRGSLVTEIMDQSVAKKIRAHFVTLKNAYAKMQIFDGGLPYPVFCAVLNGKPTSPGRVRFILDKWRLFTLNQVEPVEERSKTVQRRAPKLDKYIEDVNTGKVFRFRGENGQEES